MQPPALSHVPEPPYVNPVLAEPTHFGVQATELGAYVHSLVP